MQKNRIFFFFKANESLWLWCQRCVWSCFSCCQTYSQLAHPIQQARALGLLFQSKVLDIDNIDVSLVFAVFSPTNQPSHSYLLKPVVLSLIINPLLFSPFDVLNDIPYTQPTFIADLQMWKAGFCRKPVSLMLRLLCSFNEGSWPWARWWTRAQCWSSHSRLRSSWWSAAPKETSWRAIRSVNSKKESWILAGLNCCYSNCVEKIPTMSDLRPSCLSHQGKVMRMMYVWALCRDQEELNPNAAWRLLDISASSTEQVL